jgi:hypothetical protein
VKPLSNESLHNSFETGLERRNFIARNNLRLNACMCALLIFSQIFPLLLPWYADSNFDVTIYTDEHGHAVNTTTSASNIIIYKKKSKLYLIVSLFSVFINNHWQPINEFIDNECPQVMKSGFECYKMKSFLFAAIGVIISIFNEFSIVLNFENHIHYISVQ